MRKNGVDIAKATAVYGGIAGLIYHVINRDKMDQEGGRTKQRVAKPLSITAEQWTPTHQRVEEEPTWWKSTKNNFGKRKTTEKARRARKRKTKLINLFLGGSAASLAAYEIYKNMKSRKEIKNMEEENFKKQLELIINTEKKMNSVTNQLILNNKILDKYKARDLKLLSDSKRLDKARELKLLSDNKRAPDND